MVPYKIGATCSTNRAPKYHSFNTNRIRYRDEVRKWASILRIISKADQKVKGILDNVRTMAYISCDDASKDLLNSAKKNRTIHLEGSDEYKDPHKLVEQVLDIISEYYE